MEKDILLVKGTNKVFPLSLVLASIGTFIVWVSGFAASNTYSNGTYIEHTYWSDYECSYTSLYETFGEFYGAEFFSEIYGYMVLFGIILIMISIYVKKKIDNNEITVTSERVYGISKGEHVEFWIKNIQSTEVCSLDGVLIKVNNKDYRFYLMNNRNEIVRAINYFKDLEKEKEQVMKVAIKNAEDEFEALSQLKELLDSELITLEEFNQKKKEILKI